MKYSDENMDQLFSNKLSEQSFDIPEAFLADLNSKLDAMAPTAKKKAFPWFWSSLVVVVLGGSLVTYWLWPSEMMNVDSNTIEVAQNNADSKSINTQIDISNDAVLQKLEEENQNVALTMNVDTSSNAITQHASATHAASKKQDATLHSKKTTQTNDKKGAKKDSNSSSHSKKKSNNPTFLDKDKNKESKKPFNGHQPNQNDAPITATSDTNAPTENLVNNNDDKTTSLDSSINKITIHPASTDSSVDSALTSIPVELDSTSSKSINSTEENASIMPSTKHFELQLNVGVAIVKTTIASSNPNYLAAVSNKEERLITPDFGLHFNYWMNKISLGVGAHYYQTGEKVNYQSYQYNTYDSLVMVTYDSIFFDSVLNNNDTISITVNQMATFTDTLSDYYQGINNYQWLSIPLSFGYRFDINNWAIIPKLSLNVEVGLRNGKGTYLSTDITQFTEYDAVKIGLSYALQCEIRKEINDWHIFVSPYYRSSFKASVVGDAWEKRYQNYGINLGVGFKF